MKNKAFTLIELLVVISIIGLLASIVLVYLTGQREKARIAAGMRFDSSLRHTLGAYAVGIWNFDDHADPGQALDTSGYGNHGTIHGASYTTETPSGQGYALSFDGNDYINLSGLGLNDPSLYGGSYGSSVISLWLKSYETQNSNGFSRYMAGHHYFQIRDSSAKFRLRLMIRNIRDNVNYWPESSLGIMPNEWVHVVFVIEGGVGAKFYINGKLDKDISHTGLGIASYSTASAIGATYDSYFNGLIDEVRIYSQALEISQIESLYYAGLDNLLAKGLISEKEHQERL